MSATTTTTRLLGRKVAVRADWSNPSSSVVHLVAGIWLPTGRRVAVVGDNLAALRSALEARARVVGMDPQELRVDIAVAVFEAETTDRY